eukprot:gnl/Spiro4/14292_TR7688_c0_g1_i1.p1 gnl/Spiro4/14292_TR7688_c0_g1~~gnl/Spiro4/14292_TR7688_c0_g1_i1.p1  ORF type:complete len:464 (-),score=121.54 gnl/Spiro4/14292_TR7688_c0_g1_i1:151-1542(-)
MGRCAALVVGRVWPEWRSSAAGVRTLSLIKALLQRAENPSDVWVCSCAKPAEFTHEMESMLGVRTFQTRPNCPSFGEKLRELKPQIVLFDTFIMEEMFGASVFDNARDALTILDTQDVHFVRHWRQHALLVEKRELSDIAKLPSAHDFVLPPCSDFNPETNSAPNAPLEDLEEDGSFYHSAVFRRELSSIHRCDLTLAVSAPELDLLARVGVPKSKLHLASFFFAPPPEKTELVPRHRRKNFLMLGNYFHAPNADAVQWTAHELWPAIRAALPPSCQNAKLEVRGAYLTQPMAALDSPADFITVRGSVPDAGKHLAKGLVNFAPLRFGAGIKGKIADGWGVGTPACTTAVGAEGMYLQGTQFGGAVAHSHDEFVAAAVRLYSCADSWHKAQEIGLQTYRRHFDEATNTSAFLNEVSRAAKELRDRRAVDVMGCLLWHNRNRATALFSKFLETKAKLNAALKEK